jgi:hypothetical protein
LKHSKYFRLTVPRLDINSALTPATRRKKTGPNIAAGQERLANGSDGIQGFYSAKESTLAICKLWNEVRMKVE